MINGTPNKPKLKDYNRTIYLCVNQKFEDQLTIDIENQIERQRTNFLQTVVQSGVLIGLLN